MKNMISTTFLVQEFPRTDDRREPESVLIPFALEWRLDNPISE